MIFFIFFIYFNIDFSFLYIIVIKEGEEMDYHEE